MHLLYQIFVDPFVQMGAAPDLFAQTLWDGLVAGVLYALIALGFVLIFKASGVFNFAQGIMVVFAALTLVGLHEHGVPAFLALGLTIVVMFVLAFSVERDLGDEKVVCARDRLRIDLSPSADDNFIHTHSVSAFGGEVERGVEVVDDEDARRSERGIASHHDRFTPRKGAADGFERLAPHDQRLAPGQRLEAFQVAREPRRGRGET